jgi:hypothetical protein
MWTLFTELAKSGNVWSLFALFNTACAWRYFHDRMLVREFRKIKGDSVSMTRRRFGGAVIERKAVERDSAV